MSKHGPKPPRKDAKANALALVTTGFATNRMTPRAMDLKRWVMHKTGMPLEEIASRTRSSLVLCQTSIEFVEQYKRAYSPDLLSTKVIQVTMDRMDKVGKVWDEGLKAKRYQEVGNGKRRRTVQVVDHSERRKTVESIKNLMETVQPRGPGIQVNQQFNNGHSGDGPHRGPGMSFESRLRHIREQKGLGNEERDVIPDAEDLEDATLEEELEGIGVDLEEGDDEDSPEE